MIEPVEVDQPEPGLLRIRWRDGRVCDYPAARLRQACPCASCVDEWSGRRLLDPASVPAGVGIRSVELVGRYALTLGFTDGHRTGIYSFEMLWDLCEGGERAGGPPG